MYFILFKDKFKQIADTAFFFDNVDDILENDKEAFLLFAQQLLKMTNVCERRPKVKQFSYITQKISNENQTSTLQLSFSFFRCGFSSLPEKE